MKKADFNRCSRLTFEMMQCMGVVAAEVMNGTMTLRDSKKANGLASRVNAMSRKWMRSEDPIQLAAIKDLVAQLKVLVKKRIVVADSGKKAPKRRGRPRTDRASA